MPFKFISTIILAFMVTACETTPDRVSGSTGAGTISAMKKNSAPNTSRLASMTKENLVLSGSQEDFVVNVGDRVFFGTDSYQLSKEARKVLEKQAKWLKQNPAITLSVEGHADERGTREYNLALGERRTTTVRDYLIALGINPNRLRTVSFGKERPVDPRSIPEAWSKNRRSVSVVR